MARLPASATKKQQQELHKAKMDGKKYDRHRAAQKGVGKLPPYLHIAKAGINQRTGKPHTDAQAIARRQRQAEGTRD